jgi:DNA-binding GntR family transcriptional regulator
LLDELRDVRIALEGCVVERAVARMSADDIAAVQRIFDEMDECVEAADVQAYLRCNFAFHIGIYRHGASDVTLSTIQNMWLRIGPFLHMVAPDIAHMRVSMQAHRQILDALRARDGRAARDGIARDINDAAHDLQMRLESQNVALQRTARH